jgi:hypothetical protein
VNGTGTTNANGRFTININTDKLPGVPQFIAIQPEKVTFNLTHKVCNFNLKGKKISHMIFFSV